MRHRVAGTKFSVSYDHRRMLLRNLLTSLVESGYVTTTSSKAKALKGLFDKFITRVKKGGLASHRYARQTLLTRDAYEKLYRDVLPSLGPRNSGYTRLERYDKVRVGDGVSQVTIEIIRG